MCAYPETHCSDRSTDGLNCRAPDDIMEPDKIRILLKDIREARQAKCRQLLLNLDDAYVPVRPLLITLGISAVIANLGFMGIAKMLSPVLQILCPGLIVLSLLNIAHKLYETRVPKAPVFATFALSTIGYMI